MSAQEEEEKTVNRNQWLASLADIRMQTFEYIHNHKAREEMTNEVP